MRQCTLRKDNQKMVSWIDVQPEDVGKFVDIKLDDGNMDEGWKIISVSYKSFSKEWVAKRKMDYKNMRKMTDI